MGKGLLGKEAGIVAFAARKLIRQSNVNMDIPERVRRENIANRSRLFQRVVLTSLSEGRGLDKTLESLKMAMLKKYSIASSAPGLANIFIQQYVDKQALGCAFLHFTEEMVDELIKGSELSPPLKRNAVNFANYFDFATGIQGVNNGVAIAEAHLRSKLGRLLLKDARGFNIVDSSFLMMRTRLGDLPVPAFCDPYSVIQGARIGRNFYKLAYRHALALR